MSICGDKDAVFRISTRCCEMIFEKALDIGSAI